MTTFIKTKFKISDDQTNIDKYRLAANITEYHIIPKLILFDKKEKIFELDVKFPMSSKFFLSIKSWKRKFWVGRP